MSSSAEDAARRLCIHCACVLIPAVDAECVQCSEHCTDDLCELRLHKAMRLMLRAASAAACPNDKLTIAEDHDGHCPCGAPLREHRSSVARWRAEQPLPPTSSAPVPTLAISAKVFGISSSEFSSHPALFSLSKWNEVLQTICGRSDRDCRIDQMFRDKLEKSAKLDEDIVLRELGSRCCLPGGNVREFAGLLAGMTAVSNFNCDKIGNDRIIVPCSSLSAESSGVIPAEEALNEVAIQRLLREGRKWFMVEVGKIRDAHRSDPVNYIRLDPAKGLRKSTLWTDRYSRVLLQSYYTFLTTRPHNFVPRSLIFYLSVVWEFPIRDSISPVDLTGILVQIGILSLVYQCEQTDVLGDSLGSVRAHLTAAFSSFQRDYVQSAANLFEHKQIQLSAERAAGDPARDRNRALAYPALPGVPVVPPPLPPHLSSSAARAANIPAALLAGIRPDSFVYNQCQAHGCTVVPPAGFTTSRYCTAHIPSAGSGRGGGGGRFGGRGGTRGNRGGNRGGR
jgi:hypothetical protein